MLDHPRNLDGSSTSSVSLLTDTPTEDIKRLGGISEETWSMEPTRPTQ